MPHDAEFLAAMTITKRDEAEMNAAFDHYKNNKFAVNGAAIERDFRRKYAPYETKAAFFSDLKLADQIGFTLGIEPNCAELYAMLTPFREAVAEIEQEPISNFHPFPSASALNTTVAACVRVGSRMDLRRIRTLHDLYLMSASMRKIHGVVFDAVQEPDGEPEENPLTPETVFVVSLLGVGVTDDFAPFNDAAHLDIGINAAREHNVLINLSEISSFEAFYKRLTGG